MRCGGALGVGEAAWQHDSVITSVWLDLQGVGSGRSDTEMRLFLGRRASQKANATIINGACMRGEKQPEGMKCGGKRAQSRAGRAEWHAIRHLQKQ